ncbi:MAG: hypothetical protein M3020_17960 [Myxococcota bacterium]|nr:hypothetical protein [Myxococcota bacterium]
MAASPPTPAPGIEELEELPDDAIIEQDLRSAPTHPYQSRAPFPVADEEIVELGPDVIVGEEHGAHRPQPRMPVLQEYSSVVIAESHRGSDSAYPQGERTIVVRDRRALANAAPRTAVVQQRGRRERVLVLSASVAVAVVGTSLAMWLSSGTSSAETEQLAAPVTAKRVTIQAEQAEPEEPASARGEPPTVSIDELPVVHSQR